MMLKLFRRAVTMTEFHETNQAKLNFDSHLLVTSGVAVEELDGRTHELGQLRLGNVLLGVKA